MEEKSEKIAEVLLGTITPFQFMMGKVLGGVGVSLTTAAIYVGAAIFTLNQMGHESLIPYEILPWFFVLTILFIIMVGSGMASLGATANDSKDAQSLTFPAMLPVILPLFIIVPVIQDPGGPLATTLSLIPPYGAFYIIEFHVIGSIMVFKIAAISASIFHGKYPVGQQFHQLNLYEANPGLFNTG
mgnify:CR=1 FL=1